MSNTMFRYRFRQNYGYCKIKLVCGQSSTQARVSPHPIFSQAKEIHLNVDEHNSKFIELLQKGEVLIPPSKSRDFVKRCIESFGVQPLLDFSQVGVNLMLTSSDQDTKILDFLAFPDLLSIIKIAFDRIGVKLHLKIVRKLKNYIKGCKRSQDQKNSLQLICKSYKQTENLQQELQQFQVEEKTLSKQQSKKETEPKNKKNVQQIKKPKNMEKPTQQKKISQPVNKKIELQKQDIEQSYDNLGNQRKQSKRSGGKKNYNKKIQYEDRLDQKQQRRSRSRGDSKRYNSKSKQDGGRRGGSSNKQKMDPKILLGITGDTEYGWRERNRPYRVPPRANLAVEQEQVKQKKQIVKNFSKKSQAQYKQKTKNNQQSRKYVQKQMKQEKIDQTLQTEQNTVPQTERQETSQLQGAQGKLIFTYPKNGNNFDFRKLKNEFKLFINGSFWIKFAEGKLSIIKGDNGFIRQSKIDIKPSGLIGEGLTLRLDGVSNIQDGGDTIGNPTIKQFTGSDSQFFQVVTMQVYVPK